MFEDRYGQDVLAGDWRKKNRVVAREVEAVTDLVVEELGGFCGAITRVEAKTVELEDYRGRRRVFPMGAGFLLEGEPVVLVVPKLSLIHI